MCSDVLGCVGMSGANSNCAIQKTTVSFLLLGKLKGIRLVADTRVFDPSVPSGVLCKRKRETPFPRFGGKTSTKIADGYPSLTFTTSFKSQESEPCHFIVAGYS